MDELTISFTPGDLAKILWRKKEELQDIEDQKERDAHYEFDLECEHHCCCCCYALALGEHF